MKIASVCLTAVLLCSCQHSVEDRTSRKPENTAERQKEVRELLRSYFHKGADILRGPLTVREVDKELAERGRLLSEEQNERIIVGGPDWDRLKAKLKPDDELYFYKSDLQSWAELLGWEGYVAIRGNVVLGGLVIAMN